jgi:hypothetical protein
MELEAKFGFIGLGLSYVIIDYFRAIEPFFRTSCRAFKV